MSDDRWADLRADCEGAEPGEYGSLEVLTIAALLAERDAYREALERLEAALSAPYLASRDCSPEDAMAFFRFARSVLPVRGAP